MKIRILVTFLGGSFTGVRSDRRRRPGRLTDNGMTIEFPEWIRIDDGAFLWDEVKGAHESGLVRAAVGHETKAFDCHNKIWIDIPNGAELASMSERCTG